MLPRRDFLTKEACGCRKEAKWARSRVLPLSQQAYETRLSAGWTATLLENGVPARTLTSNLVFRTLPLRDLGDGDARRSADSLIQIIPARCPMGRNKPMKPVRSQRPEMRSDLGGGGCRSSLGARWLSCSSRSCCRGQSRCRRATGTRDQGAESLSGRRTPSGEAQPGRQALSRLHSGGAEALPADPATDRSPQGGPIRALPARGASRHCGQTCRRSVCRARLNSSLRRRRREIGNDCRHFQKDDGRTQSPAAPSRA